MEIIPDRNIDTLHLSHLRMFTVLLRERSLTRAAQVLDISQPALSKCLSKLRRHFGDPLFVRVGQKMEPTARALQLEHPVQAVLEASQALHLHPKRFSPETSDRTFSFFLTDVGIILLVPPLLRLLAKEAPHVRLQAIQVDLRQLHTRLESGEVDMAIGDFPPLIQNIRRQRLYTDGYISLVRKQHPRIETTPSRTAFLSEHHVLVSASGTGHAHRRTERVLESAIPARNIVLRVSSFSAAAIVAKHSDLIATLPTRIARLLAKELDLQAVTPPIDLPRIQITQYWHERFHREPGNRWLRSLLIRLFSEGHKKDGS
jgi:DNA-binding transcriptional LysR family regulator